VRVQGPRRTVDVLQIEDNCANTHLVERVLGSRYGLRVMTVSQGRLRLELAREHKPALVLANPDPDGRHGARDEADGALDGREGTSSTSRSTRSRYSSTLVNAQD
jgi:hypothetical protein